MQVSSERITPFLWFDTQAEEAAHFYTSVFKNSKILTMTRYEEGASAASGRPKGSVMTVAFHLDGQSFVALNGGPLFKFTEAVSFVVNCEDQKDIDYYWDKLSEGGDPKAQQCGWLKDKYGLSWQIVPKTIAKLVNNPKAMQAMLQMKRIDIAAMEKAARE